MEFSEEVQTVLDIARRVLRTRPDWISQGQVLMEEIAAAVAQAPESRKT